jgi:hypothetical protein
MNNDTVGQAVPPPPEGRAERVFIVLLAVAQGALLYLAALALEHEWAWFAAVGTELAWYSLALAVPAVMALSVIRLRDPRFWQHALLVTAVMAPLIAWTAWRATGAPFLSVGSIYSPYGLSLAVALFVALPWLQCRLEQGRWCAPYPGLFAWSWQNGLILLLALLFTGLCWLVLHLWAVLFQLVAIDTFHSLFNSQAFRYLATGAMMGLGILIGRTQPRPAQMLRQVLLAVFAGLLPLLAAIALLFAAVLPVTGLQTLWATPHTAFTLLATIGALVLFTNAVIQDGSREAPYPWILRLLVTGGLLVLPVYALLASTALGLRVAQYGWTATRVWAALICLIAVLYALSYAVAALRRRAKWLAWLPTVNAPMSWLVIALLLLASTPLLDPHRIAVSSQMARWHDGRTAVADLDLEYLRFRAGRSGWQALQQLREDPKLNADPKLAETLASLLSAEGPHHSRRVAQRASRQAGAFTNIEALLQSLTLATGSDAPPSELIETLLRSDPIDRRHCLHPDDDCTALMRDLDNDGVPEALLCSLFTGEAGHWTPMNADCISPCCLQCGLWSQEDGHWKLIATPQWPGQNTAQCDGLMQTLRDGDLTVQPPRWPALVIDGQPASSF